MKTSIFVDGNWLLHRNYLTLGRQSSMPGKTLPLRMLDSCSKFALRLGAKFGALTFDGPYNFRYDVYPEYKANRGGPLTEEDTGNSVYEHLDRVKDLFDAVGFLCVQKANYEADDLVSAGSHTFATLSKDNESWIVGRDKDSYQDIRSRIRVFWPAQGKDPEYLLGPDEIKSRFGMSPAQFGDYQVLIGDSTDNIPDILTPSKAKKIIVGYGSLKQFLSTEEGTTFFYAHQEELTRNTKLIRMDKKCWSPSEKDLDLSELKETKYVFREYGKLPDSFNQLRAFVSSRRSLF
jgi:DNA polymerase-1